VTTSGSDSAAPSLAGTAIGDICGQRRGCPQGYC